MDTAPAPQVIYTLTGETLKRKFSAEHRKARVDQELTPIQSTDAPCGSVQATGTPFTDGRKLPFGPSRLARPAMSEKTRGGSFSIQKSQSKPTDRANSSRSAVEEM
jgi:hypothetical protein